MDLENETTKSHDINLEHEKMKEYIKSVFYVFKMVHDNAVKKSDRRMNLISIMIYNYTSKMAKDYKISLQELNQNYNPIEVINLNSIFEYISKNNIELLDFENIKMEDVDITSKKEIERFVLTHVYFITQK